MSKAKGSAYERMICVALSQWVTSGQKKDCFWRASMSGGRATRGLARGENLSRQAGDISSVSPEGHALTNRFYIELKHYADLALTRFYTEQKGTLAVFWLKTKREAEKHGRMPMMIVKQNRVPTLLIAPIGQVTKISSSAQFMTRYARLGSLMCEVYLFDDVLKRSFAL